MKFICPLMLVFLAGSQAAWGGAAELHGIRVSTDAEKTRIVLDLDQPLKHNLFTLDKPHRVVVDLLGTKTASQIKTGDPNGLLKQIRYATKPNSQLRVVFDVAKSVQPRSFLLKPSSGFGHRLVIDLVPRDGVRQMAAPKPKTRDIIVAIDAGHGGKDPGASGPGGLREKDIVLNIAQRLAKLVDQQPGMRAYMVREGDTFISLEGRAAKARRANADLFVSIHADAFHDIRARGSSVYVLSQSGATSEAARWLAKTENAADLAGGVKLADKDDLLASVLLDLSQNATISASMQAARKVLREIGTVNRLHSQSVKQAGFVVLMSPDLPSIFVEAAFISNPSEAAKLRDSNHQQALAQAIMRGIHGYFQESPPPNTKVASLRRPRPPAPVQHVIRNGDTLSEIAERYNVSLSRLRAANGIRGDAIRIGQRLRIPGAI
ncbi:MAG: N-acetylmuramoyl-L-alanine amidase [Pseudomonadota bacterium]